MTCPAHESITHHVLTLKQIASWQPGIKTDSSTIIASVPSLQRGAVWEPQQIEMLWDSIMRGFPIGSIVIAKKIDEQNDKSAITSAKNSDAERPESTHHILDGQQRCNAITWGFVDPWDKNISDDIVLWLDLKPGERLKNSTRKYLFRVTTKAHPWGFRANDETGYLTTGNIRDAMERFKDLHKNTGIWPDEFHEKLIFQSGIVDTKKVKKPTPRLAMPHDAGFPVPVSVLFDCFDGVHLDLEKLKNAPMMSVITKKTGALQLDRSEKEHFESGLAMVVQSRLVALQVPSIVKGIDDIEQIFQRLNRQGTPLDNEELSYSVIKAYWPDIEKIISGLPDNLRHSTEARLVSLGVRVALTESNTNKMMSERSVEQIRNIFKDKPANEVKNVENKNKELLEIELFFKNENSGFEKSLKWIDTNFLYEKEKRSYGIPKYLRSSLAWSSRDVFAWLMLLAKQNNYEPITDDNLTKKIIGFALTIHWFGIDKAEAVNALPKCLNDLSSMVIPELKDSEKKKTFIHVPLSPEDLEKALQLNGDSKENQLKNWSSFWQGIVARNEEGNLFDEVTASSRKEQCGLFIEKLRGERELLVYAQRAYIEHNFDDFDPSNKLIWKGHNRPWDYDHILPSNCIGGTGNGTLTFTKICQAWQNSIGNLTAVDFTFNRSSRDTVDAFKKYAEMHDGEFKIFSDNLSAFVMKHEETKDEQRSRDFVLAAKARLIAIYSEWYSTLEIG